MANITIRNIPDDIFMQLKKLATLEKRSLNNELLVIIEKGIRTEINEALKTKTYIPKAIQVHLWRKLSSSWEDDRSTEDIIADIYTNRSTGRDINL